MTESTDSQASSPAPAAASALQPLIVDGFKYDGITPAKIAQLVAAGYPWVGLSMQCSHGLATAGSWFDQSWEASSRTVVGPRYGVDWFRMAYHYFVVDRSSPIRSGANQLDTALTAVERAGGWDDGDLWLGVDVERAEQPEGTTAKEVIDGVSEFSRQCLRRTGKRPLLYAGSFVRDLGIVDRMGCCLFWYPQWSSSLSWSTVVSMGWGMPSTLLWQVTGDKRPATVPGYPTTTPIGPLDFSIMVRDNLPADQALAWTRTHTGARPV